MGDGIDNSPLSLTGGFNLSQIAGNYSAEYDFLQAMLDFSEFDPTNQYLAQLFWYTIAGIIGFFTLVNIGQQLIAHWRLRKIRIGALESDLFKGPLALLRFVSYPQFQVWKCKGSRSMGDLFLVLLYFAMILMFVYISGAVAGFQHWMSVAFRAGWITVAQLPLLILLAGKNNLIGYLTGTSYERLNLLHRWVARIIFFTASLHMIYLYHNFSFYGLVSMEWNTDTCPPTGTAAWVLLFWIVFSSFAPIRNLRYELFVAQHVLLYVGFTVALSYHIQPYSRSIWMYSWVPAGFFFLDRVIRLIQYAWNNVSSRGLSSQATLQMLPGEVTMVTVKNSRLRSWTPGQHALLSIPKCGHLQSHPFTIACLPSKDNGSLKFLIRAKDGFTRCLLKTAAERADAPQSLTAFVNGPYGSPKCFAQFERVILISGGTGATFTIPLLLDIAQRSSTGSIPCRNLTLIWVMKSFAQIYWFEDELREASETAKDLNLDIHIHITGGEQVSTECLDVVCLCLKEDAIQEGLEKRGCTCGFADKNKVVAKQSQLPSNITIHHGRPVWSTALANLYTTYDETGVAVAGPTGLAADVRNEVAQIELKHAMRLEDTSGLYLHIEHYGF
ncbi:hypothetical protein BZG36_05158 [Bifiguratus adelaidae]|uniref:ferric-chelate reductase (NADPH) n=1 Tax=Bifiguratus adelaidae TaxID=1938954 RepID=A0A261XV96_9FUNG|nr:hypothetical protein BZG36_05158 [Bifiguratus adelaidae]